MKKIHSNKNVQTHKICECLQNLQKKLNQVKKFFHAKSNQLNKIEKIWTFIHECQLMNLIGCNEIFLEFTHAHVNAPVDVTDIDTYDKNNY